MSLNKVLINTNQVAEFPEISYIDNPEFAFVKMDNESRVLYGVKQDGEFFFGAGCPQQVKDYIEEKISSLSLDEYEDIVDFLNGLEEGDKTLQELLNEKVDEEDGKSLIDNPIHHKTDYTNSQHKILGIRHCIAWYKKRHSVIKQILCTKKTEMKKSQSYHRKDNSIVLWSIRLSGCRKLLDSHCRYRCPSFRTYFLSPFG